MKFGIAFVICAGFLFLSPAAQAQSSDDFWSGDGIDAVDEDANVLASQRREADRKERERIREIERRERAE